MAVHPMIAQMLAASKAAGVPSFSTLTPQQARAMMAAMQDQAPPRPQRQVDSIEDTDFPGPAGLLKIRRYRPAGEAPVGRLVYFHGGGWVLGSVNSFDPLCSALCAASGLEVLSVDYRLAPEAPFPAAIDDGWTVLNAVARNGDLPLFVGGDSAGGNIAAALALRARARGGPAITGQILLYPVTDYNLDRPSYRDNGDGDMILGTADMAWFWNHYVADPADRGHEEASPLRAADHSALPPAFVAVAGHDPLHDEGVAYAEALRSAGTPVRLERYPDMVHGFCSFTGIVDVADTALDAAGAWARDIATA